MIRSLRRVIVVHALLAACPSVAFAADGTETAKARCHSSYVTSQALRRDGKLSEAKGQLAVCKEACPASFASDCARWLDEVDALVPRARIVARTPSGESVADARLFVDGSHVELDAAGFVPVDPGEHVFRAEARGFKSAETTEELRTGEREHVIELALEPIASPETGAAADARREPLDVESPPRGEASRVPSFVLGGVGIASLATAGALAIKGHIDRGGFSHCAPVCDPKDVDAVRTTWLVAGVVGAVGAVSLGLAIVLWPKSSHRLTTRVGIAPRGVAFTWDLP